MYLSFKSVVISEEFVVVIEGTFWKDNQERFLFCAHQFETSTLHAPQAFELLKVNLLNFPPAQGCVACERRRISGNGEKQQSEIRLRSQAKGWAMLELVTDPRRIIYNCVKTFIRPLSLS